MKTPEEIEKGLEYCANHRECDSDCEYYRDSHEYGCPAHADAIALIQQLEDQLPRWNSTDEKLPEVSDVVLVIANGKPSPNITLRNAMLIASFWGEEGWIADGFEGWDTLRVTHWMKLPALPAEDDYAKRDGY